MTCLQRLAHDIGIAGAVKRVIRPPVGQRDKVRDEVDKGTHTTLPPEGRGKFIGVMMDGCCGDEDEDRILIILKYSEGKGDLRSVVNQTEGGADQIVWKLDGSQDTEVCELFDRNGISY